MSRKQRSAELRADVMARVAEKAERDFNDTRYDWLRTRPRRRQLSILVLIAVVLYGVGTIGDYPFAALAGLVVFGFGLWALRVATRSIPDLPDELVDERMREVRGIIYRWSYLTLMSLVSVVLVAYIASQVGTALAGWASVSAEKWHEVTFVLFFTGMAVPSILYAWTEPEI